MSAGVLLKDLLLKSVVNAPPSDAPFKAKAFVQGDGHDQHAGVKRVGIMVKAVPNEGKFTQSTDDCMTLCEYEGGETWQDMHKNAQASIEQLVCIIENGLTIEGRLLIGGDMPFMHALLGLSGHSHSYFCQWGKLNLQDLRKDPTKKGEPRTLAEGALHAHAPCEEATGTCTCGKSAADLRGEVEGGAAGGVLPATLAAHAAAHCGQKLGCPPIVRPLRRAEAATKLIAIVPIDVLHFGARACALILEVGVLPNVRTLEEQETFNGLLRDQGIKISKVAKTNRSGGKAVADTMPSLIGAHVDILLMGGGYMLLVEAFGGQDEEEKGRTQEAFEWLSIILQILAEGADNKVEDTPQNRERLALMIEDAYRSWYNALAAIDGVESIARPYVHALAHLGDIIRATGVDQLVHVDTRCSAQPRGR